jgi:putative membrane protein
VWPRWTMLPYLFSATLPCDMLSAFLAFCDRVVYPAYLSTPRPFGISALEDQQCAGALMWTCVTFIYLVPATILTLQLLAGWGSRRDEPVQSELREITAPRCNPRELEVS